MIGTAVELWLERLGPGVREYLEGCHSTAQRALATARLFGDQGELDFWTVAAHYLANPPLPHAKVRKKGRSDM